MKNSNLLVFYKKLKCVFHKTNQFSRTIKIPTMNSTINIATIPVPAATVLTENQIFELVDKHYYRYEQYVIFVKKTEIPEYKKKDMYDFLKKILPTIEYQSPDEGFVWVSYNFYNTIANLYYNDMHRKSITNIYDLVDDALHFYFHQVDSIKDDANFILLYPLYNSARKLTLETYNRDKPNQNSLTKKDIDDLVRFHIVNTEIAIIDSRQFQYMQRFVYEALYTIVLYNQFDPNYRGWYTNKEFDNLYEQANDRVECYMKSTDIFDITPFVIALAPEPPMDVEDDSTSVSSNETSMFDKSMIENLAKSFGGFRM
jgi:hypothetical protein